MSPTIVLGERGVELVTGAAGGPRIVSATLQILLDVLLFGLERSTSGGGPAHPPPMGTRHPLLRARPAGRDGARPGETRDTRPSPRPDIGKANAIVRSRPGLDAAADPRSGGDARGSY